MKCKVKVSAFTPLQTIVRKRKDLVSVTGFILLILFSFFIGNITSLVLGEDVERMGIVLVSAGKFL